MSEIKKKEFEVLVSTYLGFLKNNKSHKITPEFEIRFNNEKQISKIDFDNVVKQLYSSGYKCQSKEGQHLLRITPESDFVNKDKEVKKSKARVELIGLTTVQCYCEKGEDLQQTLSSSQIITSNNTIKFTIKSDVKIDDTYLNAIKFEDFGFKVSYQNEFDSGPNDEMNFPMVSNWNKLRKTYRYMNRVKFIHPDYPISADLSIIRSSKKLKNFGSDHKYVSEFTMKDAKVLDNEETYEIELEIDNKKALLYDSNELLKMIRKSIRTILSGLQQSDYPVSFSERNKVLQSYMRIIHGNDFKSRPKGTADFIGPNSMTLQLDNVINTTTITNIRKKYSVTDKADGIRTLLYISENGRLYLFDTNMNIMFTGAILDNNESNEKKQRFQNSLLDGEYIKYDKHGKIVNLFAAFDIYYIQKLYVGHFDFKILEESDKKCRFDLLKTFIDEMKFTSIVEGVSSSCNLQIKCKTFEFVSTTQSVFAACSKMQFNVFDNYTKDGLIFTPIDCGVGGSKEALKKKITWSESFKWKPPQYNTIDFLVKVKKNNKGINDVKNLVLQGEIKQYQTLELLCGFTKKYDGFLNPMLELMIGELPHENENEYQYKPVKFYPTNPVDVNAGYCNILLEENVMKTEDGDYFESDMIVEFRYDIDKKDMDDTAWKWVPIRVRYDKTSELRNGIRDQLRGNSNAKLNYGNSYKVANSNWTSINNPITEKMITSGEGIPSIMTDSSIYYKKTEHESTTKSLRNFHNLYVKRKLIIGASLLLGKNERTLIDYAVGKGGDLQKWIDAKLTFVFGIDVKKDNIENQLDGACARYLKIQKDHLRTQKDFQPKALFVVGNSELNIRDNSAYGNIPGTIDEQISNCVFGTKSANPIWKSVTKQFDVGKEGFNISSIQFALHYFFKNKDMVHQFMRNIFECTRVGGYFIGTCYDGKTIFDKLSKNENIVVMTKNKSSKMLEIKRLYNETSFPADQPCLGYTIDVWQESINKNFSEYLVNYDYLLRLTYNYGFDLISLDEAKRMELPSGSGSFKDLFNIMEKSKSSKDNFRDALKMNDEEKQISFMNKYFVFKKSNRVIDPKQIQKIMKEEMITELIANPILIRLKKINRKIIIENTEIINEPIGPPPLNIVKIKRKKVT
jgi:hypothetical protein